MTQLQAYNLLTAAMQDKTYRPHEPFAELAARRGADELGRTNPEVSFAEETT